MNASAVSRTGWAGQFRSMVRSMPAGGTPESGCTRDASVTGRDDGSGIADLQWHGRPTVAVARGRQAILRDRGGRGEAERTGANEVPLSRREAGFDPILQKCLGSTLGAQHMAGNDIVVLVGHPQHHGGLAEAIPVVGVAVGAPVDDRADGQQRGPVRVAWRTLRTARTLRAYWTRDARLSLRTCRAGRPRNTLRALHAHRPHRPFRAHGTSGSANGAQVDPGVAVPEPGVLVVGGDPRVALDVASGRK